jgi:RimJ/RimL family protein N-acetyltransferase
MRRSRNASPVSLISVYRCPKAAAEVLYRLLVERQDHERISHLSMPSWNKHKAFIASRPYSVWYLVKYDGEYAGATYLTERNHIGVWVFKRWRNKGLKPAIVGELMKKNPRDKFFANVNPRNKALSQIFRKLGFHVIQHTYALQSKKTG